VRPCARSGAALTEKCRPTRTGIPEPLFILSALLSGGITDLLLIVRILILLSLRRILILLILLHLGRILILLVLLHLGRILILLLSLVRLLIRLLTLELLLVRLLALELLLIRLLALELLLIRLLALELLILLILLIKELSEGLAAGKASTGFRCDHPVIYGCSRNCEYTEPAEEISDLVNKNRLSSEFLTADVHETNDQKQAGGDASEDRHNLMLPDHRAYNRSDSHKQCDDRHRDRDSHTVVFHLVEH